MLWTNCQMQISTAGSNPMVVSQRGHWSSELRLGPLFPYLCEWGWFPHAITTIKTTTTTITIIGLLLEKEPSNSLTAVLRPNQTNVPFVSDSQWVNLLSYWIFKWKVLFERVLNGPWGLQLEGRTRPCMSQCSVSAFLVKCQRKEQRSLRGEI